MLLFYLLLKIFENYIISFVWVRGSNDWGLFIGENGNFWFVSEVNICIEFIIYVNVYEFL